MNSRVPPYIRIAQRLRDEIIGGVIAPGDKLPSTRDLVESEGVAKATVDKAVRRLRESGLVETVPGIGLVALDHSRVDSPRDMFLRTVGLGPRMRLANERSDFLFSGYDSAPARVCELLGMEPHSRAVRRMRLIRRSNSPAYLCTSWFPAWIGETSPKLLVPEPITEGTAVYVGTTAGRRLRRGNDRVKIDRHPSGMVLEHLHVQLDEPTLYVETKWFDDQDQVLEVGIYHIVGDRELSYDYELGEIAP